VLQLNNAIGRRPMRAASRRRAKSTDVLQLSNPIGRRPMRASSEASEVNS